MAQALQDIIKQLDAVYRPQKDVYNKQITALDPQMQAEQKGLQAAQQDAFGQITDQANRRGLFYSGIPVKEQQQYTGATYLPAVANLHSKYAQQRFNLQDALAQLGQNQYNRAQDLYQAGLDRDAAERAAQRASAASSYSPSFGGSGSVLGDSTSQPQFSLQQRNGGGFNFTDPNGNAISAAQYSKATGIPFRELLSKMAAAGDSGAKAALGLVGNDYGYNRGKVNNQTQVNLLRALGLNASNYSAPKQKQQSGNSGLGRFVNAFSHPLGL